MWLSARQPAVCNSKWHRSSAASAAIEQQHAWCLFPRGEAREQLEKARGSKRTGDAVDIRAMQLLERQRLAAQLPAVDENATSTPPFNFACRVGAEGEVRWKGLRTFKKDDDPRVMAGTRGQKLHRHSKAIARAPRAAILMHTPMRPRGDLAPRRQLCYLLLKWKGQMAAARDLPGQVTCD